MSRAILALLLLGSGPAWSQRTVTPIVEVPVAMAVPLAGAASLPQATLTSQALGATLTLPHALATVPRASRAQVPRAGGFRVPAGVLPLAQALGKAAEADGATGIGERATLLDAVVENRAAPTGSPDREADFIRELSAPAQVLGRNGITRTIAVYGSARLLAPEAAAERLAAAMSVLAAKPKDRALRAAAMEAKEAQRMSRYYPVMQRFGALVTEKTLGQVAVVTGGGGGVMEAANRGASEAGGPSVGYNIKLPKEQGLNPYVTPGMSFEFADFATRKKALRYAADAHVYGPGGFGTLEELFEALTLMQNGKIPRAPVVMIGSRSFWRDVLNVSALVHRGMISPQDIKLISFVETEEEAWRAIAKFYHDEPEYSIEGLKRHAGAGVFQPVFAALERARVRYVVVGGHAVRFHGHARATPDLDLVVDLAPGAARRAIDALVALGLRPRVPEDPLGFADADRRKLWADEKNRVVFSLYDPKDPLLSVDLFVQEPVPFEELYARAEIHGVGDAAVRVASIAHLIGMKEAVGRPQDVNDVRALRALQSRR